MRVRNDPDCLNLYLTSEGRRNVFGDYMFLYPLTSFVKKYPLPPSEEFCLMNCSQSRKAVNSECVIDASTDVVQKFRRRGGGEEEDGERGGGGKKG